MSTDHLLQTRKLSALALPWPVDWAALFGASRPLILEIGFGSGTFLRHLAQQHPEASLIGLEISNQSLLKAERAIVRQGLGHVRVIHSRAETALAHLFEPGALSEVHINFPDPWFKHGHEHRRLIQPDTLDLLVSRMAQGARLYLATDIAAYAEMSAGLLAAAPGLSNLLPTPWVDDLPGRVVTKYEARARAEGRACYYFARERNALSGPLMPVMRETAMPHLVFSTPLSLEEMRAGFTPFHAHAGDIHVGFVEAYQGRKALLFEIHVSEPSIEQHTGLMLVPHAAGEFTLQLGTLGHPRPTEGLQTAVRALGQWLIGLSPDARLVQSSVSGGQTG